MAALAVGASWTGNSLSDWLDQSAPGRVVETTYKGELCFALTCEAADVAPVTPNQNPRAQLVSPPIIGMSGQYRVQGKIAIPSAAIPATLKAGTWIEFLQFAYGQPYAGSPPLRLMTQDGATWGLRHGDDQPYLYKTALTRDAWWNIDCFFQMSTKPGWGNGEGWVWMAMWQDGLPYKEVVNAACATVLPSNKIGPQSFYLDAYMLAGTADRIGPIYFTAPTVTRIV